MAWQLLGMCRDLAARAMLPRASVPWIHGLLSVLAFVLAGCDRDECVLGEVRCRDNVAEYCDYEYSDGSAPLVWNSEDCGQGVCKAGLDERPFCALGDEPDPRCAESPSHAVCDQQQQVHCNHGYATAITDCATSAGYCVVGGDGALCATDSEPSEHCPDDSYATACEGDTLLTCSYGYTRSREACPSGDYCVVTPGFAMCNPSAELDPSCPPAAALAHVCDGDAVVECIYGYRNSIFHCALGEICRGSGSEEYPEAFCTGAE